MAREILNERSAVAIDVDEFDVDQRELLEFLEADLLPSAAHPAFRSELREHLRQLLRERGTLRARAPSTEED